MSDDIMENLPPFERPLRIPSEIDVQPAEPPVGFAGVKGTWRLLFRLARDVAADAILKLQFTGPRNNHHGFVDPQVDRPGDDGYIRAIGPDGADLALRSCDDRGSAFIVDVPAAGLKAGGVVTVIAGDASGGGGGVAPAPVRALSNFFVLYVADAPEDEPKVWATETAAKIVAACTMHVTGGPLHHLCALAPSQASPGEAFNILIRPEDEFDNLSRDACGRLHAYIDREELDAVIEPAPQSTCVRLRVTARTEGVHRIDIVDRDHGLKTVTNPVRCVAAPARHNLYWGMIHGHTELSDGTGSIDRYFGQMRDEAALDFAAPGDHDHEFETSDAMWQASCEAVKRWHKDGEFVIFPGYEWAKWRRNGDGDRNIYYRRDDPPMYRSGNDAWPTPGDLFRALRENDEEAIVIPHHTACGGNWCDFKDHDPVRERLIEIYQCRGSYECLGDDNPLPEGDRWAPQEAGTVRRALALGWRVGFTGGGDNHIGTAGAQSRMRCDDTYYREGLTCVLAAHRTREAVWDALWNRRVVATSGERIILDYDINDRVMGSELSAADLPVLDERRRIRVEFHGAAPLAHIDIIRNNETVHRHDGGYRDLAFTWEDDAPLADVLLPPAKFCGHRFCFYYVRAVQENGGVAWASPIWIDP